MKSRKWIAVLLSVALAGTIFAGCSPGSSGGSGASEAASGTKSTEGLQGTITLGASAPLTGDLASDGLLMKQGIQLAINEINQNGGVLGKKLDVIIEDDQGTQNVAVNTANKLISDKVAMILGPHLSTCVQATDSIMQKAKMPFLTGATSPNLEQANDPYFHRVRVSDKTSSVILAKYAVEKLGAKKVAIMFNNDTFGTGGRDAIIGFLKSKNVEYISEGHNSGEKDFTSTLTKIKGAGCDSLITWTHDAEVASIAKQIKSLGIQINKLGSASITIDSVLKMIGPEASEGWYGEGDYISTSTDSAMTSFYKKFKDTYATEPNFYAATYYGATYLAAHAITEAGSTDPEKINSALKETKDLPGVVGTFTYGDGGNMIHQCNIAEIKGQLPYVVEVSYEEGYEK